MLAPIIFFKYNIMAKQLQIKKAERRAKKLKCLITGASGFGKTMSSLLLAKGLTDNGKILVFDTENGRSGLKCGSTVLGGLEWDVIEVDPTDLTSQDYISAIKLAEDKGYDVIIIDSASQEWVSVKDSHQRLGGKFTDWGKAKKPHHDFVRKVISCQIHVILTARSDIKHEQQEVNGKKQVVKLGLGTQQNSDFPFEMDFVFDIMDRDHNAEADKSEGGLFDDTPTFVITEKTGRQLADFLSQGITQEEIDKRLFTNRVTQITTELLNLGKLTQEEVEDILSSLEPMTSIEITKVGKGLAEQLPKKDKKKPVEESEEES